MRIRSNLSFGLNHERHYLKNYGVFHFSDIQCYVILFDENGGIFGPLSLNSTSYSQKNPGMLYTVGFKILSRLRISNFHFPKMTWQVLMML